MAQRKIPLYDNVKRSVTVETDATIGAVVGVNLFYQDGTLVDLAALTEQAPSGEFDPVYWRQVREVPANLVKLAALTGAGFTTRTTAGDWYQRSIQQGEGIGVTFGDGADGDPMIALADLPNSGTGTALLKITRDGKGRLEGTSAATTSDLAEGSNQYFTNARADARITAQKGQPNGLSDLDAGGKIPTARLPALAITETFVVASQAAQLALTAQEGDVAVRTDLSKNYIRNAGTAGTMADWTELLTPAAPVQSVNGKTGTVSLVTDDIAESGAPTNQWFTAARVRAVVLTGLSTATNAAITAADTVLAALGKLQAQITSLGTSKADKSAFTDYISGSGLRMKWISGTSFSVSPGACYVPSLGYVLDFPLTITKSGLSLSANTWYHAYGLLSGATRDIEFVSTAPAAPYSGDARTKTGDTSRRYIGSLRTDASGNLIPFEDVGDSIKYTNNVINNIVLSAGNATVATSVDVSPYCPVTSRLVDALCYNSASSASGAFAFFSNSEAIAVSSSTYLAASAPTAYLAVWLLMDSAQKITYTYNASPGGGGAFVRVMGYKFAR